MGSLAEGWKQWGQFVSPEWFQDCLKDGSDFFHWYSQEHKSEKVEMVEMTIMQDLPEMKE